MTHFTYGKDERLKGKQLAKQVLGSRWLKIAVVVIVVGIAAYEIEKEWTKVHQALGQIGLGGNGCADFLKL